MRSHSRESRGENSREIATGESSSDVCRTVAARVPARSLDRGRLLIVRQRQSQREMIRDVMLAASDCGTWLTLGELRALTSYGEASISAQLRHLRKPEYGGYELLKRHREDALRGARGESLWEYRLKRCGEAAAKSGRQFQI
jgi:PleD family two-component response regulator